MGAFDGWNYYFDSKNMIDYFFDYTDINGEVIDSLSGDMVCHGFLTTLEKLFPSLPAKYGNEPISIKTFEQLLGLSFSKLYPDDEEDNAYFSIISSKKLAIIIYTDENIKLPSDSGISVVEDTN
ncbi:hypothetical protein SDC9_65988 [bioreactor metagenome]|uniref:Uncharacterized protein n=1 Tax=bioreactor metagenome TaxID=1076179 RepID=A0A644XTM5_9ZZZZ